MTWPSMGSPYPCAPESKQVAEPEEHRGFLIEWDVDTYTWTPTADELLEFEAGGEGDDPRACRESVDCWWDDQEALRICWICRGTGRVGSLAGGGVRCDPCDGTGLTHLWRMIEPVSHREVKPRRLDILEEARRVLGGGDAEARQLEADLTRALLGGGLR